MIKRSLRPHLKTALAIIWFAFTFSMVAWWWAFFLLRLNPSDDPSVAQMHRSHRMFAWEGSILLAAILFGGVALVIFTYRDQARHQRLRFFFSTFSHDIKTSIARLRLQAEVLEEELHGNTHPVMKRLIQDIQRLDLQLENSLLLSNLEASPFLKEDISLSALVSSLRTEFSELSVELDREAILKGDRRALLSVFKNLFQNSVLHGKASTVKIKTQSLDNGRIKLQVSDNGLGFKGDLSKLGSEILISRSSNSNGIGLLITKRLVQKMGGDVHYDSKENSGFTTHITLGGSLK